MESFDFNGKIAIVTGSTRGIGKAIAEELTSLGCTVIQTGTKPSTTDNYKELNLLSDESVESFLNFIKSLDRIDILVNNAGINKIEEIDEIKDEHWDDLMKVNLTGPMVLTREVSKKMKEQKSGRILNISSVFSLISRSKRASYSATKSGINGMGRAIALDLAPYGILVNSLCVGFTLTELTKSILSENEIRELENDIPMGRLANVEDIAKAATYLCSDYNTYVTGQTITVDGGVTIK
jgi:3-oxoacyl-[acyl-carrier protein] reductase